MRIGAPVFLPESTPELWVEAHKKAGYSAAYCPVSEADDPSVRRAYMKTAQQANLLIAEVGAWSNPLSKDDKTRKEAIEFNQIRLALADEMRVPCCVNIAGSRGEQWDGPDEDNITSTTFDLIVETVRAIIDAVKPTHSYYCLEPMPWIFPYSADTYLDLLRAIDRKQFGVHLDPVNMVNSPIIYQQNSIWLHDLFAKLGPSIVSCHAKDIYLSSHLTTHLDEVRPGLGKLDYSVYLTELSHLHPDTPLMIEHLATEEEYRLSAEYICRVANQNGLHLV